MIECLDLIIKELSSGADAIDWNSFKTKNKNKNYKS